jgi:hypothetical protein
MNPTPFELVAAVLFALAIVHTFCTRWFEHLAHARPRHAGLWHLLGEVETVFGFWAIVMLVAMVAFDGWSAASSYLGSRGFVEPAFVFVIMVMAASRPVLQLATDLVGWTGRRLPLEAGAARYAAALSLVPLLGSLITEPAAMTLAALMLRDRIFARGVDNRFRYGTLGVLFVNVSVGGTLTSFAAPPVLMVAGRWDWTTPFMFANFGWKAIVAVLFNAAVATWIFRRRLAVEVPATDRPLARVPAAFVALNVALVAGVVIAAHRHEIFLALFLLFLGLADAYKRHHGRLVLREGLLVASFLAGLVVLGGQQAWWLQTALTRVGESAVFYWAMGLTAITDNAALTYLGSLVSGITEAFQYALVAGAIAGGGLTVIANAPNPAGFAILKGGFDDEAISPLGLFTAALAPTAVAAIAFQLPSAVMAEVFRLEHWAGWLRTLDPGIAFLFVLPVVVGAIGLWAERRRRRAEAAAQEGAARSSQRRAPRTSSGTAPSATAAAARNAGE